MGEHWTEKYSHLICKGLRNEWLNPGIQSYVLFVVGFREFDECVNGVT